MAYDAMATVANAVSEILKRRPFIEEGLMKGIINYAYLADLLKPEVEEMIGKKANRYAIVMAVRRLTEILKKSFVGGSEGLLADSDVTVTSGIFVMTVRKDSRALKNVPKMYDLVDFAKGDFLTITHGIYEMTIISNSKYRKTLAALFSKHEVMGITTGLSTLVVRISKTAADTVGVLYTLIKALSWENINIVEVVSTQTEEIFIISESDAAKGFAAMSGLVKARG